jgi:PAS domain S-box-containing protein
MFEERMMPFLQSLCEHAGIAIIATDERFIIRFWNAAAERMFEEPTSRAIGQPIWLIIPPERHGLAQRMLERAVLRAETSEVELRRTDRAGRTHHLAVTMSPIPDHDGRVVGVSICIRDVTQGMDLLRDVAEMQRMSALGSMAGAVAHHFNNLLGGALTALDFAQDADDSEQLRRALKTAMSALGRVSTLTHGLLVFAEGDHSETPTGDAAEVIRQFISGRQATWSKAHISVRTQLQPLQARLPVKRLTAILEALTANACEAMVGGGILRIELVRGPGMTVILRISDTGKGIPQEQLRHVFEPFFTTKRVIRPEEAEHAGLGLAVVHGIVKDMGGTITLEHGESGGTVCTVCLPADLPATG